MTKRAAVLLPSQLRHLIRVTEATSRHPERDTLILWLGFSCGMRVTETARLTVADVLMPSGLLRSEISLRAEITKGCRQRLAYLTNPKLIAAMDRYIEWRLAKRFGCSLDGRQYRGLMPKTRWILTWKGGPTNSIPSGQGMRLARLSNTWPLTAYKPTSKGCIALPDCSRHPAIADAAPLLHGCLLRGSRLMMCRHCSGIPITLCLIWRLMLRRFEKCLRWCYD